MSGKNRIEIKQAKNRQNYVEVKSSNNKILAVTETYKTSQGAKKAASALKRVVKNSVVVDKTKRK